MTQLSLEEAVAYLTEKPEEINLAWSSPAKHIAGCLFQYVSEKGFSACNGERICGCLTQIRGSGMKACSDSIGLAILDDDRLPNREWLITPGHLPFFLAWQQYLDCAIRGVDPTGIEFCPIVLDLARKAGAWLPEEKPKRELPAVILDCVNWTLVFESEKNLAANSAD